MKPDKPTCVKLKLLDDKIGENLGDPRYGSDFLDKISKEPFIIEKNQIDKLEFIKMKNLCSVKDNVKRMRRQAIDFRKSIYLQKITSDKEIYLKYTKNS